MPQVTLDSYNKIEACIKHLFSYAEWKYDFERMVFIMMMDEVREVGFFFISRGVPVFFMIQEYFDVNFSVHSTKMVSEIIHAEFIRSFEIHLCEVEIDNHRYIHASIT